MSELSIVQEGRLEELATTIKTERLSHAQSGLAIGKALAEAHEVLAVERQFKAFVEKCEFSLRTAYHYMTIWRHFGGIVGAIDQTAMYALGAANVPESARQEAKHIAEAGAVVSLDMANKIIAAHRESGGVRAKMERKYDTTTNAQYEAREQELGKFREDAARHASLPPVDDDTEDLAPFEVAEKLFSKATDTIYRLVRLIDDINGLIENEPLRESIQMELQGAVQNLRLWKRGLR